MEFIASAGPVQTTDASRAPCQKPSPGGLRCWAGSVGLFQSPLSAKGPPFFRAFCSTVEDPSFPLSLDGLPRASPHSSSTSLFRGRKPSSMASF